MTLTPQDQEKFNSYKEISDKLEALQELGIEEYDNRKQLLLMQRGFTSAQISEYENFSHASGLTHLILGTTQIVLNNPVHNKIVAECLSFVRKKNFDGCSIPTSYAILELADKKAAETARMVQVANNVIDGLAFVNVAMPLNAKIANSLIVFATKKFLSTFNNNEINMLHNAFVDKVNASDLPAKSKITLLSETAQNFSDTPGVEGIYYKGRATAIEKVVFDLDEQFTKKITDQELKNQPVTKQEWDNYLKTTRSSYMALAQVFIAANRNSPEVQEIAGKTILACDALVDAADAIFSIKTLSLAVTGPAPIFALIFAGSKLFNLLQSSNDPNVAILKALQNIQRSIQTLHTLVEKGFTDIKDILLEFEHKVLKLFEQVNNKLDALNQEIKLNNQYLVKYLDESFDKLFELFKRNAEFELEKQISALKRHLYAYHRMEASSFKQFYDLFTLSLPEYAKKPELTGQAQLASQFAKRSLQNFFAEENVAQLEKYVKEKKLPVNNIVYINPNVILQCIRALNFLYSNNPQHLTDPEKNYHGAELQLRKEISDFYSSIKQLAQHNYLLQQILIEYRKNLQLLGELVKNKEDAFSRDHIRSALVARMEAIIHHEIHSKIDIPPQPNVKNNSHWQQGLSKSFRKNWVDDAHYINIYQNRQPQYTQHINDFDTRLQERITLVNNNKPIPLFSQQSFDDLPLMPFLLPFHSNSPDNNIVLLPDNELLKKLVPREFMLAEQLNIGQIRAYFHSDCKSNNFAVSIKFLLYSDGREIDIASISSQKPINPTANDYLVDKLKMPLSSAWMMWNLGSYYAKKIKVKNTGALN